MSTQTARKTTADYFAGIPRNREPYPVGYRPSYEREAEKALNAARAELRRKNAERIALDALTDERSAGGWGDLDSLAGDLSAGEVTLEALIDAVTAAVLAALTEMEARR